MFGRKHHQGRRSPNILFVIFRLILSVIMFAILLGGIYSAYKYFSGYDPLKLDPVQIGKNLISAKSPKEFIAVFSKFKAGENILGKSIQKKDGGLSFSQDDAKKSSQTPLFRFILIADSHNNNTMLANAITQSKRDYPDVKFIIGLGDWSDVGTISELKKAKEVLDSSGLRYFLIAGDHDLWDCRNRGLAPSACFKEVFGPLYQVFTFENFQFVLLNNSDNYSGLGEEQKKWVDTEFERIKENPVKGLFVFLHEPLYHPSSEHVMGKTESSLKEEAKGLMFKFKEQGVKKVFSADTHFFSQYEEPVTDLPMMTVGALSLERNPQTPRFAIVSVLEDGSTKIEDIEVK